MPTRGIIPWVCGSGVGCVGGGAARGAVLGVGVITVARVAVGVAGGAVAVGGSGLAVGVDGSG
jgi:hypothetical protein